MEYIKVDWLDRPTNNVANLNFTAVVVVVVVSNCPIILLGGVSTRSLRLATNSTGNNSKDTFAHSESYIRNRVRSNSEQSIISCQQEVGAK